MNLLTVVQFALPVALAATGETVVQRAGIINVGLEGQMLAAAFFGVKVANTTGSPALGIVAGILAGIIIAAITGLFVISLNADQVVVGTATTLGALGITSYLFRQEFGQSGALLSVPMLPKIGGMDAVLVCGPLVALVLAIVLVRTPWGLALRSVGEYPKATEAAGYSIGKLRWQALLCGGALAGLAGAYLSLGVLGTFSENMTQGRGFIAIAMVTFGRWTTYGAFLASLLVGYLEAAQFQVQSLGWKVPHQLLLAAPYIFAIAVLALLGRGAMAPAHLGQKLEEQT